MGSGAEGEGGGGSDSEISKELCGRMTVPLGLDLALSRAGKVILLSIQHAVQFGEEAAGGGLGGRGGRGGGYCFDRDAEQGRKSQPILKETPGKDVSPNSPYGLCGCKATLKT